MTIRIYALAKELHVESKVLIDLCQQLGIKNKAAALTNLTDDDVEKIKKHLAQQPQKAVVDFNAAPANNAPIPPSHPTDYGKVPDLTQKIKSRPKQEESDKDKDAKPQAADSELAKTEQATVQTSKPAQPETIPESTSAKVVSTQQDAQEPSSKSDVNSGQTQTEPQSESVSAPSEEKPTVKPSGPKMPVIHVIKRAEDRVVDSSDTTPSESKQELPQLDATPSQPKPELPKEQAQESTQTEQPAAEEKPVESDKTAQPEKETPSDTQTDNTAQQPDSAAPAPPVRKRSIPVINVIGHREERKKPADSEKKGKDERRRGPLQRLLAPMPEVKPPAQKKEREPAAQKPEIRLSTEVIRNVKAGKAPLEKHLKQAENQRQEELKAAAEKKKSKKKNNNNRGEIQEEPQVKGKEKASKRGGTLVMMNRDQRQQKRKDRGMGKSALPPGRKGGRQTEYEETPNRAKHLVRTGQNTAAPRKNKIIITLPITVRSFAEEIELPVTKVIAKLMQMGMPMAITASMDADTAELVAAELNLNVEIRQPQSLEEKLITAAEEMEDAPEDLKSRPPVITFLGHVDHGKTSLLDRIIGIDVCSGEKGGITQHIRAYQISKDGNKITFVDTPGHQAFTEMRARGANCTDIAVLVVAADDGVMPQTEEAISHARAAGVPIVVALNKIDIPGVNVPKVLQELAAHDVLPSEWGGDVEVVKCSALTGEGVDDLLDTILTVAELHDYKANPKRAAMGICLESQLNQDQGAVAKVLVQKGTLRVGDIVVCGSAYGRVKSMTETLQTKNRVQKAPPSMPVNLFGLDKAPGAGDKFYVLDDITEAREIAARKAEFEHQQDMAGTAVKHVTLEDLFSTSGQTLNIILRTDVRGSIEAIKAEIAKLENPEVQIRILQAMVGGITEADVALADASNAIIFGFNVVPDENARVLAEQKGVQIRRYDIIYKMTDDIKAAMEGMLKPEEKETELGRIVVQKRFVISHVGTIAGCRVLTGMVQRGCRVRLIRENRIIGDYAIDTLKREKDDVKEVQQGYECGIKLQNFNDIKEGDVFEAYKIEEVSRKL
ncbi:MAG: translation initiation factor IF-2 [Thermoguttaceae bacterium]|nr:translation initiation factor IF-2 [Thermoguttaceae bacterium]